MSGMEVDVQEVLWEMQARFANELASRDTQIASLTVLNRKLTERVAELEGQLPQDVPEKAPEKDESPVK